MRQTVTERENDFVKAYTWMYGTTKKKALEVFKTAHEDYVSSIIYAFRRNAKEGFYHD